MLYEFNWDWTGSWTHVRICPVSMCISISVHLFLPFSYFHWGIEVYKNKNEYLPGKTLAISAHLFPCDRCAFMSSNSSSNVQASFFISGFKWLCHLKIIDFTLQQIHKSTFLQYSERAKHEDNNDKSQKSRPINNSNYPLAKKTGNT